MKKWLRNTLLAGTFLAGSLGLYGQGKTMPLPSGKELKKELGTESLFDLRNLGHGYITIRNPGMYDENFERLKTLEGIARSSVKIDNNGRRTFFYGNTSGDISQATSKSIDLNGDSILTPSEITGALNKKYQEAFLDYASKTLNVSKEEIVQLEKGYATSKDLKDKLNSLAEFYKIRFEHPKAEFYDMMSGKDAVITKNEIEISEKLLDEYKK